MNPADSDQKENSLDSSENTSTESPIESSLENAVESSAERPADSPEQVSLESSATHSDAEIIEASASSTAQVSEESSKEPSDEKTAEVTESVESESEKQAKEESSSTEQEKAEPGEKTEAKSESVVEPEQEPEQKPEPEPEPEPEPTSFESLNLQKPIMQAVQRLGFEHCTPIQAQSLRYTLEGHDVTGKAQTGTGKTAAFLITIINDLLNNPIEEERYLAEPRALIIAPTRELVIQIANDAEQLTHFTDLHTVTLVGGEDYAKQNKALDKKPVDIVVATPGRLLDFVQNDNLYLGMIELLVLDEADRMLDMGFIPQVRQVISRTPKKDCRQTLLFSATFTPEIMELGARWSVDPIQVEVAPEKVAADAVEQIVYLVTTSDKYKLLYNLISDEGVEKVMVFSNRRDQVRRLADDLYRNGVSCGMLSGEIAQHKRIKTLDDFKSGKLQVLVATDVAGRGLHINDVTHVINYTLPEEAEDYVHRIGRTGRAGAIGTSISFACEDDSFLLPAIEDKLGSKLPCTHPGEEMLVDTPAFSRPSHFKASKPDRRSDRKPSGNRPHRPHRR